MPRTWKGLSRDVLEAAGVVVRANEVRLPYREPDGAVRYWRVKRSDGREWFAPKPSELGGLIPFGLETLSDDGTDARLFVAEGESDCLALREAFPDWYAVALPGAGSWRSSWRRYLERFPVCFLVPDGDTAGARMARAVRRALPWARLVLLSAGEDARSLVQAGGAEALRPHLDDAERRFRVEAALRLSDPDPSRALASFLRAYEEVSR